MHLHMYADKDHIPHMGVTFLFYIQITIFNPNSAVSIIFLNHTCIFLIKADRGLHCLSSVQLSYINNEISPIAREW